MKTAGIIILGLLVLAVIFKVCGVDLNKQGPVAAVQAAPKEDKQTLMDAYGMACDFVRRDLQWPETAKCEISKDECTDYGNNEWLIVGYIMWDGHRKRYTAQIVYNPQTKGWKLSAAPAVADVS